MNNFRFSLIFVVFLAAILACRNKLSVTPVAEVGVEVCEGEFGCNAIALTKTGLATVSGFSGTDTTIYTVAEDSQNNFYLGGTVNSGTSLDGYIIKFDTINDIPDPSFGTGGARILNLANTQYIGTLVVDGSSIFGIGPDDTASPGGQTDFLLAKFDTTTGNLDASFNTTGVLTQAYPGGWYDSPYSLTISSDNKIYTCGFAYKNGTTWYDSVISRYSQAGVLDTTFGSSGHLFIDLGTNATESCYKVLELSDGRFLVYSIDSSIGLQDFQPFFRRYNSDWSLDTTFGTAGTIILSNSVFSHIPSPRAIYLDGDDLYMLGSSQLVSGGDNQASIFKMNLAGSGSLESSFGDNGFLNLYPACPSGYNSFLTGAVLLDETILMRGTCEQGTKAVGFIVSLLKTGELDPLFNDGNPYLYLEDVSANIYEPTVHIELKTNGAKVYTHGFGKFNRYDLDW